MSSVSPINRSESIKVHCKVNQYVNLTPGPSQRKWYQQSNLYPWNIACHFLGAGDHDNMTSVIGSFARKSLTSFLMGLSQCSHSSNSSSEGPERMWHKRLKTSGTLQCFPYRGSALSFWQKELFLSAVSCPHLIQSNHLDVWKWKSSCPFCCHGMAMNKRARYHPLASSIL